MRAPLTLGASASLILGACAHYRTTSTLAATDVGVRGEAPAGFASGETSAIWIFGLGPFGSEAPETAVARARGKALEMTLSDVTVERRVTCVPACELPIYKHVRVTASGSLLKPTGYRDPERPEKPAPVVTTRFPKPSQATLVERLENYYRRDPAEAENYYQSLGSDARANLEAYVVSELGLGPVYNDEFRAPASASADDCRFLRWFLHEHTAYRLSADSCAALK